MPDGMSRSDRRPELMQVIHKVRDRWRLRLALRGAVIVVAGTLLALFLSASSLEALRFSPSAIISFRIIALAVFAALGYIGLVRPLMRRVDDTQVAMYLEEKDPSLQAAILSAVETSGLDTSTSNASPRLVERLVEQAIERCRDFDDGLAVERHGVRTNLYTLVGVALAAALLIVFGPAYLRHGLTALLEIQRSAEAASPYQIEVQPGDVKIARGMDQIVKARLQGFTSKDASVMMRNTPGGSFEKVPLIPSADPAAFEGVLFHVEKGLDYYVESNGVRSKMYTMTVVDLPVVEHLINEYHFPAYTDLQPRTIDPGGDVAALKGTNVSLKITPSMKTPGGRVLLNDTGISSGMPGVEVRLDDGRSTRTDAGGNYAFTRIPFGEHRLEAVIDPAQPFFFTTDSRVVTGIDKNVDFTISLLQSSILGTLRNDAGAPIAGVTVAAHGTAGSRLCVTRDDGTFELNGLPAGEYTVETVADSYPSGYAVESARAARVITAPGAAGHTELTSRAARSVSGRVVRYDTNLLRTVAVAGARVRLVELAIESITDANGEYLFRELPAGEWTIATSDAVTRGGTLSPSPIALRNVDLNVGRQR